LAWKRGTKILLTRLQVPWFSNPRALGTFRMTNYM